MKIDKLKSYDSSALLGLLEIQLSNHINVIPESKRNLGFVTLLTPPSFFAHSEVECSIATNDHLKVVGYVIALPAHETFANNILEMLKKECVERGIPSGGKGRIATIAQICVDRKHRQEGIAFALYAHIFRTLSLNGYGRVITEIDATNSGSKILHQKLGFEQAAKYEVRGQSFEIIQKNL